MSAPAELRVVAGLALEAAGGDELAAGDAGLLDLLLRGGEHVRDLAAVIRPHRPQHRSEVAERGVVEL